MSGSIAGLIIILPFVAISQHLATDPLAFHTMIGLAIGLHGAQATLFGFVAHMLTAVAIGVVFCLCSTLHPAIHINRTWKGVLGGTVTGIEVYAIFFLPITSFIVMPMFGLVPGATSQAFTPDESDLVSVMGAHLQEIIGWALAAHVIFGFMLGIFSSQLWVENPEIRRSFQV